MEYVLLEHFFKKTDVSESPACIVAESSTFTEPLCRRLCLHQLILNVNQSQKALKEEPYIYDFISLKVVFRGPTPCMNLNITTSSLNWQQGVRHVVAISAMAAVLWISCSFQTLSKGNPMYSVLQLSNLDVTKAWVTGQICYLEQILQ